jgi:hypothetical protein
VRHRRRCRLAKLWNFTTGTKTLLSYLNNKGRVNWAQVRARYTSNGGVAMEPVVRLKEIYAREKKLTVEVLQLLDQIEQQKIFALMGYDSVFKFCVKEIGYNEGSAYRRVAAMRLLRFFPEAAGRIESGELALSNAALLGSIFHANPMPQEPARALFQSALGGACKEAEQRIRAKAGELGIKLKDKYELPPSLHEKLTEYANLVSHKYAFATHEELLHALLDQAIELAKKQGDIAAEVACPENRHVPEKLRWALLEDADFACSYVSEAGHQCGSGYMLEIDHILPFAKGGRTELGNLRVLCRVHNLLLAELAGLGFRAGAASPAMLPRVQ